MKQSIPLALVASFSSSSSSSCFDRSFCHPVSGAPCNKLFSMVSLKTRATKTGRIAVQERGLNLLHEIKRNRVK